MSKEEIQAMPVEDLTKIWNGIAACFDRGQGLSLQSRHPIGFLMLSRETERRGLEIDKDKFGKIILKQKA